METKISLVIVNITESLESNGIKSYPRSNYPSFELVASNIKSYHYGSLCVKTLYFLPSTGLSIIDIFFSISIQILPSKSFFVPIIPVSSS
jgi:hypothetical protein